MTQAVALAQLGNSTVNFRNRIINGDMQIWQRGTSITVGSGDTYSVDRWTAREAVVSQSTDVPVGQGFKYSMFYDNGGVRTSINIRQKIEDGKVLLENIPVTLSFWAKGSSSETISVDWTDTNLTNISLTTTWQRFEVSFPASEINPNSNFSGSAWIDFNFGGNYPDVWLTGVQLEVGSVATPFEHRPYGAELALCQRYYQKSYPIPVAVGTNTNAGYHTISMGGITSNYYQTGLRWKVSLRATPTVTIYNPAGSSGVFYNTDTAASVTLSSVTDVTSEGIGFLYSSSTASNSSQRYAFHYVADAEL